jgi:hypothetical protein
MIGWDESSERVAYTAPDDDDTGPFLEESLDELSSDEVESEDDDD